MKRSIIVSICLLCFNYAFATTFTVGEINYSTTSETTVEVVKRSGGFYYIGSISIPASVTYNSTTYSVTGIGEEAFTGCSMLMNLTIPSSVTSIADGSIARCTQLSDITVDANNSSFVSVSGVVYNKQNTVLIACPSGKSGSFTIPSTVTSIGKYAFSSCNKR